MIQFQTVEAPYWLSVIAAFCVTILVVALAAGFLAVILDLLSAVTGLVRSRAYFWRQRGHRLKILNDRAKSRGEPDHLTSGPSAPKRDNYGC